MANEEENNRVEGQPSEQSVGQLNEQAANQPSEQPTSQPNEQSAGQSSEQPTDMVETAREAQLADSARTNSDTLRVIAPAKVNLFLNIGSRRPDGYHEAISIMHALTLHDVLHMCRKEAQPQEGLVVEVSCQARGGVAPLDIPAEENIVNTAIRALAEHIGRTEDETIAVRIEKHIPAEAGLGGGSSDAAAALVGTANLWGLSPHDPRIEETARSLGADVPFFLHGGCACLTGAGDVFSHNIEPMGSFAALIKPEGGVSTAEAYQAFDDLAPTVSAEDCARALSARHADEVPLRNNLVEVSEQLLPVLAEIHTWAKEHEGVAGVLMSGSGSAVFVCCDTFGVASKLASEAQTRGWWGRATTFGPVRAAIVP